MATSPTPQSTDFSRDVIGRYTATRPDGRPQIEARDCDNWGYTICDTAMRKWVDTNLVKPTSFPYPISGIG